jgi:aromatic ring hydroxylase
MDEFRITRPHTKNAGIRSADEYLAGLQDNREVWHQGERISDVTSHPAMARGANTLASFLQRQHEPELQDKLTYLDDDGNRCAMAFLPPKSAEDIKRRGAAYYEWATWSHGMFGRTPDYKNASLMSFATAKSWLDQGTERGRGNADFAANMQHYYD